jgi:hypothetical protein
MDEMVSRRRENQERIRELEAALDDRPQRPKCVGHERRSVQDIQLELIGRTSFNAYDGKRVLRDLREARSLEGRTRPLRRAQESSLRMSGGATEPSQGASSGRQRT